MGPKSAKVPLYQPKYLLYPTTSVIPTIASRGAALTSSESCGATCTSQQSASVVKRLGSSSFARRLRDSNSARGLLGPFDWVGRRSTSLAIDHTAIEG